jgi:type I restriction enzyme, S subunit
VIYSCLPSTWALTPLREIGAWRGGGTPSKSEPRFWRSGEIPWISPKDMKTFEIADSEDHITEEAIQSSSAKLLPEGSVLVVTRSGILERILPVAITKVAATLNQDLKGVTPYDGIDPKYLAYALKRFDREIRGASAKDGTTVASIEFSRFLDYQIPLAPTAEQRRIVEAIETQLTRLDAAVAALERAQANLKRYRASVLKAAVEGQLVPTEAELARQEGREFESGKRLMERIRLNRLHVWESRCQAKRSNSGYPEPSSPQLRWEELPEGWAMATLEQITSATRPITYGILKPGKNHNDGVPYVEVKDIRGPMIRLDGLHRTHPAIAAKYPRTTLVTGDLVLGVRGTFGRVAEIPESLAGGNLSRDVVRLDISPLLDRSFIRYQLSAPNIQSHFAKVARGVAVKGVNNGDVKETLIAIPPAAEQHRIVHEINRRFSVIDDLDRSVSLDLKRAHRLRRSLLKRAFEGKLVPQAPSDEPASALLERIQEEATSRQAPSRRRLSRQGPDTMQLVLETAGEA